MNLNEISVRLADRNDYKHIIDYFLGGSDDFLKGMGVAREKLPDRVSWLRILLENHEARIEDKSFFYVIWMVGQKTIGHSNINKIVFGEEAYVHLHMWREDIRKSGLGFELMKNSIPYYFEIFQLKHLFLRALRIEHCSKQNIEEIGF